VRPPALGPETAGTRERLLAATRELIEGGGYAAASVAAIADRAGVAAGTLYLHFPSKAQLFLEVFHAVARRDIEAMYLAAEQAPSATERLDAVVGTYARRALERPRLAWALVHEPVDPLVDAERLAYRREYRDGIAVLLREGMSIGEFPEQDTALPAAAIVGIIAETLVGPLSPVTGETTAREEVVAVIVALCRRVAGAAEPGLPRQHVE